MMTDKKLLTDLSEMLKVIAHPVRLCIVRRLWREGSCNVTFMQECLEMPQSTISQHLAKLKQAGIIVGERQGLEVKYSLKNESVKRILQVLFENQQ